MSTQSKPSLLFGLKALKQGDYQTAKDILEAVATREQGAVGLQAQIGLVVVYSRSQEVAKAISLCETLTKSHHPQVKNWANRSLLQLTKRHQGELIPQELSISPSSPETGSSAANTKPLKIHWRLAGRAKTWQPLDNPNLVPLWLLEAGTFVALFWVIRELLVLAMRLINNILVKLPYLQPLQFLYSDPTILLLLVLFSVTLSSPWLLDWFLREFYGQRKLAQDVLNAHSPEAVRVLQRCCQKRGWKLPKLSVLPMAIPVAFTYGHLPRTARIVVSQGLLEQLADDEIAAIYAHELGHIAHWDFVAMAVVLLVTMPIYRLYHYFSVWGDRTSQPLWRKFFGIIASFFYGVWCLLTGTALFNSQLRLYYSDRFAAEITGNPNALIRAILKINIGIASDIHRVEHTSWQLESLNLLSTVSYQQSICLGSIAPHTTFESFLRWDCLNPHRWWFVINNSHPLMGERIFRLCSIARDWHLEPELNLQFQQPLKMQHQSFLLQAAPFLGIPMGFVFAFLIWLVWQLSFLFKFLNLKWIYEDWSFMIGCLLIGFSIGTLIRINAFFPEINPAEVKTNEHLSNLLVDPALIPIDSIGVRIVGKLLGRRGLGNLLGQDLILQSNTCLVKLHHHLWLGQKIYPQDLIGRQIIVTGWLRRGATPWIDIQTLQTQSGKIIYSPHPIWSMVLAIAAQAWGAYILLQG